MNWAEYADASRRLAEVRRREAERRTRVQERTATARSAAERLRRRLAAQRDHLVGLARQLREPTPSLDDVARSGLTDADEALRRAWTALEQSDVEARQAQQRAQQPALLPGLSTTGRNALVYTVAAVLAALASAGLWAASDTDLGRVPLALVPWQLCGLPAMAFFAGYLTIALFGRPRVATGEKPDRSLRLGGLICFVSMWLFWFLLVASSMG
jgi:hypothetical protein